jgi:hypothetical protein
MTILATVLMAVETLMKVAPQIMKTVGDVRPFAESFYEQMKGEELTDAERAELRANVDAVHARVQAPQPPAQPGDPDYVPPEE